MTYRNIYLAARYSRRPEIEVRARQLQQLGHLVVSRWVWGGHHADESALRNNPDLAQQFAREDLEDIDRADMVVVFTDEPRTETRGGKHFELGFACGLIHNKEDYVITCVIVGQPEHVFHTLPCVRQFDDWGDFLEWLDHN